MGELDGKTVLLTGAGGSIGRAIAHLFVEHGANVACADVDASAAAECARSADAGHEHAASLTCDITDEDSTRAAVHAVINRFGPPDVLVNCAAAEADRLLVTELDRTQWDLALTVNLTGSFLISKAVLPAMIQAGAGVIIHLGSHFGRVGIRGQAAYSASKAGLIQLVRVLAIENAADGIRVNALSPGAIVSDRLTRHYGTPEAVEQALAPKYPVGRLGTPEEVARAALFLAADGCSFITGADLVVDGGYTAQ
jgi:NAD(P)-dependent dehydrogenase (short-subunit alcohol dehydrogenase family)